MWRMRVVHATGYAYKSPVTASFNEARLTPRSDSRQNVILNRVETVPATRSVPLRRLLGHGGDDVRSACPAHRTGGDRVLGGGDRQAREPPDEKVSWEDLASEAVIDRFDEFLSPDALHAGQ